MEPDQEIMARGSAELDLPTHHESVDPHRHICVVYCQSTDPGRRTKKCPYCYGKLRARAAWEYDMAPVPSRFGSYVGGWVTSFMDALVFPFRRPQSAERAREELIKEAARGDRSGL